MASTMSRQLADELYEKSGTLIPEDSDEITIEKYNYLLKDSVHLIIQEVLKEHPLPFMLQEFQLVTLHCLGSLKNVVLLAPTGAGKMICAYYGILVLQKVFGVPKGVGLVTQPLR
jgi:superfamily II RNA helicase